MNEANGMEMRRQRGCESPTARPLFDDIPGFGPLDRCPVSQLTNLDRTLMRLYLHFEEGRMGPIQNLPAALVDAMEIITQTIRGCEREKSDG